MILVNVYGYKAASIGTGTQTGHGVGKFIFTCCRPGKINIRGIRQINNFRIGGLCGPGATGFRVTLKRSEQIDHCFITGIGRCIFAGIGGFIKGYIYCRKRRTSITIDPVG